MRLMGILAGLALLLPFVLPAPKAVPGAHDGLASASAAPGSPLAASRAARELDLDHLVWALDVIDRGDLSTEGQCLAKAVYFEARGEPLDGQLAVAQVILNRVKSPKFPNTICEVVFQNETHKHRCQFSFACDGVSDTPFEGEAWELAKRVSFVALSGRWEDITFGAKNYHAVYVRPAWSDGLVETSQHGRHIFYRDGGS